MALAFDRSRTFAPARRDGKTAFAQGEVWFARCVIAGTFSFVATMIVFL